MGPGRRGEKVEARTRRTRRRRGDAGRRKKKRSDGQRTVVEQRRCYFRMNVVEGPVVSFSLVESKIKGRGHWEKETQNGRKERRGTSVVNDDDSVSYLAQIVARHRAKPRSYKPLIRVRQSTGSKEREGSGKRVRLCLAERSSLMSRRYDVPRPGLFPLHHGSIPINKAVNAARVDWPEIIRALWNCTSSGNERCRLYWPISWTNAIALKTIKKED